MAESATHAGHDPLRVAAAVDRGARLAPVLDLCARCARLYAELVALTAALPLTALPTRPRAFTLSADDARRLRPRGWQTWWSAVGSARDTVTQPLAVGLTTLGLAGLFLTTTPTFFAGAGASSASGPNGIELEQLAASPLPSDQAPSTLAGGAVPGTDTEAVQADPGASPTLLLSIGLLVVGGSLFVVRRVAVHGRPVR